MLYTPDRIDLWLISPKGRISPRWPGATLPPPLSLSLALSTGLGILIMATAASLRQNAVLLNFTIETLESQLKRITWINFNLTHGNYQRNLRLLFLSQFLG
jgi:hypothetical protein